MKRLCSLGLALILLVGCLSSSQNTPTTNINSKPIRNEWDTFEVSYGETVQHSGFKLTFADFTEEECAPTAGCENNIQQLVYIDVVDEFGGSYQLTLTNDPTPIAQSVGSYLITVEEIKLPSSVQQPSSKSNYIVTLGLRPKEPYSTSDAPMELLKPVLYLYPPTPQSVNVKLDFADPITFSYPDYQSERGWEVLAYPDGHLINQADQQEYSYLFWEGTSANPDFKLDTGFVVAGKDTKTFFQQILPQMGLLSKEYNEFIVYWYPQLATNEYNLIHFATEEYNQRYPLQINPAPDTMFRVFMVYQPLTAPASIPPQQFKPFTREGFTVVEWGGQGIPQ